MAGKVIKNSDQNFNTTLDELVKRFHGQGGDEWSESHLCCNKQDLKEGFVYVWSNNKDVAKLITRSRQFILEVRDLDEAVQFKMAKQGFRSVITAFKVGKQG